MKEQLNISIDSEKVKPFKQDALDLNLTLGEYAEIAFDYFQSVSEKTRRALVEKNRRGK